LSGIPPCRAGVNAVRCCWTVSHAHELTFPPSARSLSFLRRLCGIISLCRSGGIADV
jgi:hypothetical protein